MRMTGVGERAVQTAVEARFVADCNVKPLKFVGQVRIILARVAVMVSCGRVGVILRWKIVPKLLAPPK